MKKFLRILKKLLGKSLTEKIRPFGHGVKALFASAIYRFPSRRLRLIGITGTKGKTTTTVFTGRIMNLAGIKAGYISTAVINLNGDEKNEFLNPYKMTTIDSFVMQKYLRQMVANGCKYAVLEMSSQGLAQNRHLGLGKFEITSFLNLFPEHIEAHGNLENYKLAKGRLFKHLAKNGIFIGNGDTSQVENTQFMESQIPEGIKPGIRRYYVKSSSAEILEPKNGIFKVIKFDNQQIETKLIADFDVLNSLFALKILECAGSKLADYSLLTQLKPVPGRMEFVVVDGLNVFKSADIATKNNKSISILVDYAHEPESMKQFLETLNNWKNNASYSQVIHILSSDGAGRDNWKKPVMGDLSHEFADYTILTTDNYDIDDNPELILYLMSVNFDKSKENINYFKIVNRLEAFKKALEIASDLAAKGEKILIVSTGVGSEQGLTQPQGTIEWDERKEWTNLFS